MTLALPRAHEAPSPTLGAPAHHEGGALRRLWRGRPADPAWVRPTLLGLLAATALLYLVDLGASGWANAFYSAAVEAGTKSWKAFFFGSFDASNFITVDKPPAFLWVMEISARLFGLNAWSILVPQALEGVAAVGLLYATVRRWFGAPAGLVAGALMALTPVAVVMFRFNNPDALLVLLLVAAAYATTRALERGQGWWLALAAGLVGVGFITKMLQAFLVLPAIGLVYLVAAPIPLRRRLLQGVGAVAALVVSAGWWPLAVSLWPAGDRPYVGGSQDNSIWNLVFGYNGFGRLSGNEAGSVGGGLAGGHSVWGPTGWDRLFTASMGGQISWLLPAALVLGAAGLAVTARRGRCDRARAALLLWGGWLVVTAAVFSFAQGIIHPYYTVALAPPIAALVAIGATMLWRRRAALWAIAVLGLTVMGTSVWAFVLLERSPSWLPGLRYVIVLVGLTAGALLVASHFMTPRATTVMAVLGAAACLGGPLAYALDAAATPEQGAIPSAGPAVAGAAFGPGGAGGGRFAFAGPGGASGLGPSRQGLPGGLGSLPGAGQGFAPPGSFVGRLPFRRAGGGFAGAGFPGGARIGAGGGLLNAATPGRAVVATLRHDASSYRWVAATVGANSAAGYQLGSDEPVMAIGGFNGTDPAPTLAAFEADVARGEIHYFIAGGRGGGPFGGGGGFGALARAGAGGPAASSSGHASAITAWVEAHFRSRRVDGVTLYDLAPRR